MSLWIEKKYAHILSGRLQRPSTKSLTPFLLNFRCPLCGDSKSKKSKTRGYIYERDSSLSFKCHNCNETRPFWLFLKEQDETMYREYRFECIRETQPEKQDYKPEIEKFTKPRFQRFEPLKSLSRISQLPLDHPARKYVDGRCLPKTSHHKLYYCKKFATWVNTFMPDKFSKESLAIDEPRLIIPFIDQNGYVFGLQGRSFRKGDNVLRYITIMLDESKPKVFGLDEVDLSKTTYIMEGPLDSLFIPNSLAMAGADLSSTFVTDMSKVVMVFDNQPRNKEVVEKVQKTIESGLKVVIWPTLMIQKDINDLVMSGMTVSQIQDMIDTSTYSGPTARLHFIRWKRT